MSTSTHDLRLYVWSSAWGFCLRLCTAIPIIIEGLFQVFQRFPSSKLVLKTVESCFVALIHYWNGSTRLSANIHHSDAAYREEVKYHSSARMSCGTLKIKHARTGYMYNFPNEVRSLNPNTCVAATYSFSLKSRQNYAVSESRNPSVRWKVWLTVILLSFS
jgi:hypothetical protein